ncbi:MAG: hypothetical protein QOG73_2141 [Acetobacteraceae bacterium]|jgi:hypothetical protein|nr:hypothetical protein [Acetobacteraceae bacterium]
MTRIVLGFTAALALLAPLEARADFHIRSPYEIDFGELEIEHNGAASFDRNPDKSGAQSYTIEFGTGLTRWWHSEIELGFNRDPGFNQPTLADAIVTENIFQLTEPGQYFADFGFYVEYGQSLTSGRHAGPNELTFGPLIAKDIGRTTTTVNLFLTRELGPNQDTQGVDFTWAAQTRWNLWAPLSPAVEIYGDSGVVGRSPRLSQQQLRVGPVGIGALSLHQLGLGNAGKIKYEVGWLFGATEATAQGTLRWRLELEIPF